MFTRRALCFWVPLVFSWLCGCEREHSKPLPGDAGDETTEGPRGPFGGTSDPEPNPNDGPRRNPEPEGDPKPLPAAVPAELPETRACGDLSCRDVLVGDILVPPCCPDTAEPSCGLELEPVTGFMPLQAGCAALEQPGNRDTSCPDVFFNDPTELRELPGCCTPEGTCGVVANLSLLSDFGCVDPRSFLLGAPQGDLQPCTPKLPEPEPEPEPEPTVVADGGAGLDASAPRADAGGPSADASAEADLPVSDAGFGAALDGGSRKEAEQ